MVATVLVDHTRKFKNRKSICEAKLTKGQKLALKEINKESIQIEYVGKDGKQAYSIKNEDWMKKIDLVCDDKGTYPRIEMWTDRAYNKAFRIPREQYEIEKGETPDKKFHVARPVRMQRVLAVILKDE